MIQKGLQLIAQFNFQRALGCFHPQKSLSRLGDKKPECRVFHLRQLRFSNRFASKIFSFSTRAVNSFFRQPSASSEERRERSKVQNPRKGFLELFLFPPLCLVEARSGRKTAPENARSEPATPSNVQSPQFADARYSQCIFRICTSRGLLRSSNATTRLLYWSISTSTCASSVKLRTPANLGSWLATVGGIPTKGPISVGLWYGLSSSVPSTPSRPARSWTILSAMLLSILGTSCSTSADAVLILI